MAKSKTFVSFSRITALGAQRVIYRAAITAGKDAVSEETGAAQTAVQLATYLTNLGTANTLYPVTAVNPTLLADLQAKVEALITEATAGGYKIGFKIFMAPSSTMVGEGAFFLVVKTPAGKTRFEYNLADVGG